MNDVLQFEVISPKKIECELFGNLAGPGRAVGNTCIGRSNSITIRLARNGYRPGFIN